MTAAGFNWAGSEELATILDRFWVIFNNQIGVRDLVARGYFIPGGASQRGGGQAPAFRVARCRTGSHVDIRLGPVGSRQGSSGLVGDPYGSVS